MSLRSQGAIELLGGVVLLRQGEVVVSSGNKYLNNILEVNYLTRLDNVLINVNKIT